MGRRRPRRQLLLMKSTAGDMSVFGVRFERFFEPARVVNKKLTARWASTPRTNGSGGWRDTTRSDDHSARGNRGSRFPLFRRVKYHEPWHEDVGELRAAQSSSATITPTNMAPCSTPSVGTIPRAFRSAPPAARAWNRASTIAACLTASSSCWRRTRLERCSLQKGRKTWTGVPAGRTGLAQCAHSAVAQRGQAGSCVRRTCRLRLLWRCRGRPLGNTLRTVWGRSAHAFGPAQGLAWRM